MVDSRADIERILADAKGTTDPDAQETTWRALVAGPLARPDVPFELHWDAWQRAYANRPATARPAPAYVPTPTRIANAHVTALARELGLADYAELHRWSVTERAAFWTHAIRDLGIPFAHPPTETLAASSTAEDPAWLPGARLNISDACFEAEAPKVAIILGREGEDGHTQVTYGELNTLVNRVARGLQNMGLAPGDGVALYLPMTVECIAAYLGVVRAGLVVVSIADSFAPPEVAARVRLGEAKAMLTTSAFTRGGKTIDLYAKTQEADAPRTIVIPAEGAAPSLRDGDVLWNDFLGDEALLASVAADPYATTNILFSSGTTGDPKAIPWTHLTPIKGAMDARYHQDIHHDDVVCWPTSIGWMMGPWLIYAALANRATMALYEGAPNGAGFLHFVEEARVTMLGVVPALVRAWRASPDIRNVDWSGIRVFSSTGEASNAEDYLWLMSLARYQAPVIEYCGGTEIGGGHLTGTVVQPQAPATFSTPALGLDVVVLDENAKPVGENRMGEIYLVPPSLGLSQRLINRNHHEEYFVGTPAGPNGEILRRHGDEVQRLAAGYYAAHGRADDTMNLGGIKVSSLELERVMDRHPAVYQSAAVAIVPPGGGAEKLVVFVVPMPGEAQPDVRALQGDLQGLIKKDLNPLFRVGEVVLVDALPRTASNKIMRRELRKNYARA